MVRKMTRAHIIRLTKKGTFSLISLVCSCKKKRNVTLPEEAKWSKTDQYSWSSSCILALKSHVAQNMLSFCHREVFFSLSLSSSSHHHFHLFLINTWMWTAFKQRCWTCICYCFSQMKWPSGSLNLKVETDRQTQRFAEPRHFKSCASCYSKWIKTVTRHDRKICFKYQMMWNLSACLLSSYSWLGLQTFVLGLTIQTDSKNGLSGRYVCDLLYCIFESFSFRQFFLSFMSPELNMIVMCHNVILVLI